MKRRVSKLERTAFHEAGHAIAVLLAPNMRVRGTSVVPTSEDVGACFYSISWKNAKRDMEWALALKDYGQGLDDYKTRQRVESIIMVNFAGVAAESLLVTRQRSWTDEDYWRRGGFGDLSDAKVIAECVVVTEEVFPYLDWLWVRTRLLLAGDWWLVSTIAEALVQSRELSARQIMELVRRPSADSPKVAPFYSAIAHPED